MRAGPARRRGGRHWLREEVGPFLWIKPKNYAQPGGSYFANGLRLSKLASEACALVNASGLSCRRIFRVLDRLPVF